MRQDYPYYDVTVIDDCSTDRTIEIAQKYPVKIHRNEFRSWSGLTGMIPVIKEFDPQDIVVEVDGDDPGLADSNVLSYLNEIYQEDIWLTYGQFKSLSELYTDYCCAIGLIKANPNFGRKECFVSTDTYRKVGVWVTSHLRTWKKWLWSNINEADFRDGEGNLFVTCSDCASMYPMIEMAGEEHIKFIDKILYVYNDLNPCKDEKILKKFQRDFTFIINKPIYKKCLHQ
jgi:glycosyltransferase involved in cell wall biosynthesis